MQYTPLWTSILRSPKVFALDAESFRFWALCLVIAQEHDRAGGSLPDVDAVAFTVRLDREEAARLIEKLVAARFIDASEDGYRIHDWKRWRGAKSDPTAAERKRLERERKRSGNVTDVTLGHAEVTPTSRPVTRDACDVTRVTLGHATYIHTEQDIQNTPQTPHGGGVAGEASRGEGGGPAVAPAGSAAWKAVVDSVPQGWGPQGEAACVRLLGVFPADVVAFGMEKVQDKFGADFPAGAAGWWRTVCHNNPDGRPKAKGARRADPPIVFSIPDPEKIYHPEKLRRLREAGRA